MNLHNPFPKDGNIIIADIALTNKKCSFPNCPTKPFYGIPYSQNPEFCYTHCNKFTHRNVIFQSCSYPDCPLLAKSKYNGFCKLHFTSPSSPKSKSNEIFQYLSDNFDNSFIYCKTSQDPDKQSKQNIFFLLELNTYIIIIKINEFQSDFDIYKCDLPIKNLKNKSIVIIHFNPDSFKSKNGKRIPSCWSNKNTTDKITQWNYRLSELHLSILHWLINTPNNKLEEVFLFHDK